MSFALRSLTACLVTGTCIACIAPAPGQDEVPSAEAQGLVQAAKSELETRLDASAGSFFVSQRDRERRIELVRSPEGKWKGFEVLSEQSRDPVLGVSHAGQTLAIQAGDDDLVTAVFETAGTTKLDSPLALRDLDTGKRIEPVASRDVPLGAERAGGFAPIQIGHVIEPDTGEARGLVVLARSNAERLLLDYDFASGPVRRTLLPYVEQQATLGSAPASAGVATPSTGSRFAELEGRAWLTIPGSGAIELIDLGALQTDGPLEPQLAGALPVSAEFRPESLQLGIIAILIGLVAQPVPALAFQEGDTLFLFAFDGARFRLVTRQSIPVGTSGTMEVRAQGPEYRFVQGNSLWGAEVGASAYHFYDLLISS